jgi:pyruvate, orthophosphate dikinase
MPKVFEQLKDITRRMEKHYRDMQDFEFTIQDGKLYMLQTRNGKRTGLAAVRVAIDMVREGLITQEEAIFRVEPNQLYDFLVPRLVEKGEKIEVLATGLPASPGAAVGQIVFTAEEAVKQHNSGAYKSVILVRGETTPEDIAGMEVADGILTSRGGMTSHAAVVTRGMGKCCVAGAGDCTVDEAKKELRVKGKTFRQGDYISLDGTTGRVIEGTAQDTRGAAQRSRSRQVHELGRSGSPFARSRQRRHSARRQKRASVRRRGHRPLPHRAYVLCRGPHRAHAHHDPGREREGSPAALKKLLPMQRADFIGLFKAMESLPVTIRLLDPPLHEFLPKREDLLVEIQHLEDTKPRSPKLKELRPLLARVEELHEQNPMLGLRGCRLGITFPEITEMQARAIIEAAVAVKSQGRRSAPRDHDPAHRLHRGDAQPGSNRSPRGRRGLRREEDKVDYMVGTMIELPRAALTADQIAEEAEFFSFGTNDLTQTTFGISRDDINNFLPAYLKLGIFKQDPFATLDQAGVGQLVKMAVAKGRNTRPKLKVGICGEHGGDPESVKFCHKIDLNYVSCSPFRLLDGAAGSGAGRA